jgi:L-ascorbate metabolism protein UlaG (beta-lactamase superfamily)
MSVALPAATMQTLGTQRSETPSGTVVEHLGHTSFAIEHAGRRVLIDPIVARRDLDLRVPVCPQWYYDDLDRVDAVVLSHGHDDHLHPPSLLGLPRDVPVYFLDEDATTCSCDDDPRRLLSSLGFRDIRPFRPGDRLRPAEGVLVEAVPARPSSEGEEQVCFVVETPDVVVLDAVDIQDGPETRRALDARRRNVDVAFVPTGASLQWNGYWNQMDAVEAAAFCRWLEPARVATCGGAVSLAERPRVETLERYPDGLSEWLAVAGERLEPSRLFARRPPFRLHYQERRLLRWSLPRRAHLPPPPAPPPRTGALWACAFTGYDPQQPLRKVAHGLESLEAWLGALADLREALASAPSAIGRLLERAPSANRLPAGLLAPSTIRHLLRNGALPTAARLCALCPPPPADPVAIERTFFQVAAAILDESEEAAPRADEYRAALWIDTWIFRLFVVHARIRGHAPGGPQAAALRERHVEVLRAGLMERRPVLGPHHFRVDRRLAPLVLDEPLPEGTGGVLYSAAPGGVVPCVLSDLECVFLDLCDGRTGGEIVEAVCASLALPRRDVEEVLSAFLARLTRASVLLVNWSS